MYKTIHDLKRRFLTYNSGLLVGWLLALLVLTTMISPVTSFAKAALNPKPVPSFTALGQAPAVVATTFGIMAASNNYPDPSRPEELNGRVVTNQPQAVRVISALGDSGWIDTTVGLNSANPVNVAKITFGLGTNLRDQTIPLQIYLAPVGTSPTVDMNYPVTTTVSYNPLPGQLSAYVIDGGSCSQIAQIGTPNKALNTVKQILNDKPNLFIHMGDTSYVDDWNGIMQDTPGGPLTYTKFAAGARAFLTQPDVNALMDKVLSRVVLDDHDSGPDNDYATTVYPAARQAYQDVFATSFDNSQFDIANLTSPTSVDYDTFYVGAKTQAWVLSDRFWADQGGTHPNGQTYASQLGIYQRNWLKSTLAASNRPIKIIYSPRSFTQSYQGGEQQEILATLRASLVSNPNSRIIIVSGDTHAAGVWQVGDPRIQEYLSGPLLNSTKHSVRPLAAWQVKQGYVPLYNDDGSNGLAVYNVYSRISVDEVAGTMRVDIVAEDGSVLYGQTFSSL